MLNTQNHTGSIHKYGNTPARVAMQYTAVVLIVPHTLFAHFCRLSLNKLTENTDTAVYGIEAEFINVF